MMLKLKPSGLKYAIPSIFTLCAMCAAFYAILEASSGFYNNAVYGVIIAMIFDSLDGRSARFTNTCTAFGASFDSITDMLAYGVSPAVMIYCWKLFRLGKIGYIVCFIFCACAALRLARFNVMLADTDKKYFQGLSSTIAGGFIVTFILACVQYSLYDGHAMLLFAAVLTLVTGLLMVSNLKFYSFKEIHGSPKLVALGLLIALIILISLTYRFKGIIAFGVLATYICLNVVLQPWFKSNSDVTNN
ncbi:MAG: CDP-alcohol phosphatidyltransferase family protein [Burkholderiales bacterium]